jgi:hypothetical protein
MSNAGTALQRRQGPEAQTHEIGRPIHTPLIKEGLNQIYTSPEGILLMRQENRVDGGRVEDPRRCIRPPSDGLQILSRSWGELGLQILSRSWGELGLQILSRSWGELGLQILSRSWGELGLEIPCSLEGVVYILLWPCLYLHCLFLAGRATTAYLLSRLVRVDWSCV